MNKKEYRQEGYNLLNKFKDKSDMFSKDIAIIIKDTIKEHFSLNDSFVYNRAKKAISKTKDWKTVQEIIEDNKLPKDIYGLKFQLRKLEIEDFVESKRVLNNITWKKGLPPIKYRLKK